MAAKSTTARGLGWKHQKQRVRLLAQHRDGTLCWWCGCPMYRDPELNPDGNPLNADHSHTRADAAKTGHATEADRLMHDKCNKERGDGSRDHQRPALLAAKGGHTTNTLDWS
ncbi:hypothetical protein [Williamsia sp.]|uniref:hypothetical protein n=1 Tax=Williamsia sp. TaxID=1872085 RepID=UPI002F92983B